MKIGLALSGGGARGAAHVGVLRCLRDHGIPVDLISGASAGAIAAGLYASGMPIGDMERFALSQDARLLDYDLPGIFRAAACLALARRCPLTGLVRGNRLNRLLHEATGSRTLAGAKLPLAISATDLDGGDVILFVSSLDGLRDTEDVRYIREGTIADAASASATIPMVFAVCRMAGLRLVDGGVLENMPVNVLYRMGADAVVAVDLARTRRAKPARGFIEVGQQSVNVMSRRLANLRTSRACAVIAPDMEGIGTFDFGDAPLCLERGYEAALKMADTIKKAIKNYEEPLSIAQFRPIGSVK